MSSNYKITVEQGATYNLVITYKDPTNVAINLTGYTARMDVRGDYNKATPAIQLTTENGRIALGGAAGTITLALTATETAGLRAGSYLYDLELVNGATVTRLLEGEFEVTPEITK